MAIELAYETISNPEELMGYPKLYKVYREDGVEVVKALAEFADAPEEDVVRYIKTFKTYLKSLVDSIPEVKTLPKDSDYVLNEIEHITSYLNGAIPRTIPGDEDLEAVEE